MKKTLLFLTLAMLVVGIMVSCNFGYTAKTYKVVYDYNYGDNPVIVPMVLLNGSSAIPMEISRKGYDFDGWYTDKDFTELFDFTTVITEDITLYAKWSEFGKGTATVSSTDERTECGWVQLWTGGPKFAEFNVGSTITNYASVTATSDQYTTANIGGHYQWGGTTDEDSTTAAAGTTYSNSPSDISGTGTIGTDKLGDTAKLLWGENWRMLTVGELNSMVYLCSWVWCDGGSSQYVEGCTLAGYKVSGAGDYANNNIFLPAAGYYDGYGDCEDGVIGDYWTSTPSGNDRANRIEFNSINGTSVGTDPRGSYGYSVRAVLAE